MDSKLIKKVMRSKLLSTDSIRERLPATYQPRLFSNDNLFQEAYVRKRLNDIGDFLEKQPADLSVAHIQLFAIQVLELFQHETYRKQDFSKLTKVNEIWEAIVLMSDDDAQEKIDRYQSEQTDEISPPTTT